MDLCTYVPTAILFVQTLGRYTVQCFRLYAFLISNFLIEGYDVLRCVIVMWDSDTVELEKCDNL